MKLVELLEKYCEKYDDEYITHDHCFDIVPASEEELKTFEEHCHKYHRQICQGHDGILVLTYSHRKKCPCDLFAWALLMATGAERDFVFNYDIIECQ